MEHLPGNATADTRPQVGLLSSARRFRRSAGFAWRGLVRAWQQQPNFRLEVYLGVLVTLLALWLRTGLVPVVLSAALVLSLELVNSSVEAVVDIVSPSRHPLAAAAKDMSAAAVLVASFSATVVGLWALGPALLQRLIGLL